MLQELIKIIKQAGEAIRVIYEDESKHQVQQKADNSPVTAADLAANTLITEALVRLTPTIPILSEETTVASYEQRKQWGKYWLIDPLDGTKEFVHKKGEFTVNIALINNHQPCMGLVYAPILDQLYFAEQGKGAYIQLGQGDSVAIKTRSCPAVAPKVVVSRRHGREQVTQFLQNLPKPELVEIGSSLKICLVAEGKADLYPRFAPTSEWDTAAAHAVLLEAGGVLLNTESKPIRYNTKEALLNPSFIAVGDVNYNWQAALPVVNS